MLWIRRPSRLFFEVGEGDEVAGGIFDADFARAIKSSAFRHIDIHASGHGFDGCKIIDFQVKKCRTFANVGGNCGNVLVHAGEGLIHNLGGALLQNDESKFVAVRDFDLLDEPQVLSPEREYGFDFSTKRTGVSFLTGMSFLLAMTASLI